jgi:hypothetical protein
MSTSSASNEQDTQKKKEWRRNLTTERYITQTSQTDIAERRDDGKWIDKRAFAFCHVGDADGAFIHHVDSNKSLFVI